MNNPITPPPELVEEWIEIAKPEPWKRPPDPNVLCAIAAQWGADQELESCCSWVDWKCSGPTARLLRKDRRPKPPSLKEQALLAIDTAVADDRLSADVANVVRRALEQLDD